MESLGGLLFPLLILLLFIPIFLSGRKQRRQVQEMQQLQSALETGDVVTTTSGLRGTVVDASYQDTVDLEIADGVVTTWLRAAVRDKVADAEPALAEVADDPTDDAVGDAPIDRPVSDRPVADRPGADRTLTDGPDRAPHTPIGSDGTPDLGSTAVDSPSDANGSHRP